MSLHTEILEALIADEWFFESIDVSLPDTPNWLEKYAATLFHHMKAKYPKLGGSITVVHYPETSLELYYSCGDQQNTAIITFDPVQIRLKEEDVASAFRRAMSIVK